MADVKWIKITTNIFADEKILVIEQMPEADTILVIWFKLLCMAGRENNYGVFLMNGNRVPYTDEMLAAIFRRPLQTVRLALSTFERFGMIEIEDSIISISNWEKHQNADGLEKIREQNRLRVARHRENQKLLRHIETCQYCGAEATGQDHIIPTSKGGLDIDSNKVPCCIECNRIKNDKPLVDFLNNNRDRVKDSIVTTNAKLIKHVYLCNVTDRYNVTHCNATEEEREEDKDKKKNKKDICALFEHLWKLYPCKKGKGRVSDSDKNNIFDIGIEEMERAIDRYKTDLEKDDWRKPQNGSTFFHSGYIDYLDSNYVPDQKKKTPVKNTFNDFKQNDYNFDEIEKKLLKN